MWLTIMSATSCCIMAYLLLAVGAIVAVRRHRDKTEVIQEYDWSPEDDWIGDDER